MTKNKCAYGKKIVKHVICQKLKSKGTAHGRESAEHCHEKAAQPHNSGGQVKEGAEHSHTDE